MGKTAVCFGCRTRYQTFRNRTMRRGRDIDAAGWHLYLAFKQWRMVCTRCRGVKVERRTDWPRIRDIRTGSFQPVGTLCRDMSNKTVAQPQHLHEHTVKNIDRRYRQAWPAKTPSLASDAAPDQQATGHRLPA